MIIRSMLWDLIINIAHISHILFFVENVHLHKMGTVERQYVNTHADAVAMYSFQYWAISVLSSGITFSGYFQR